MNIREIMCYYCTSINFIIVNCIHVYILHLNNEWSLFLVYIFLDKFLFFRSFDLEINYETSPNSTALQWLESQQTSDRHQPFVFSQCQAIHARALVPCQDTPSVKSTFNAKVNFTPDKSAFKLCIYMLILFILLA